MFSDIFEIFENSPKRCCKYSNIYKDKDSIVLEYNLAGYKKDEVSVTLDRGKNILEISASSLRELPKIVRKDLKYTLDLTGFEVSEDTITTKLEDGILKITLKESKNSNRIVKIF